MASGAGAAGSARCAAKRAGDCPSTIQAGVESGCDLYKPIRGINDPDILCATLWALPSMSNRKSQGVGN